MYQSRVSKEILEKRRKLYDDFASFRRLASKRISEQKAIRLELRDGQDTDSLATDKDDDIEYTVQFLVESKKEEVAVLE